MTATLNQGARLGPYEVLSKLGEGGMGEVYKARDARLDRTVAIKILPAHMALDADATHRFEREARAIAALNHPHICTLHDIGHQGSTAYIVMEFVEGQTLAALLEKGPLTIERALDVAIQVAHAVDCAHGAGIVHRDLKPANIMLTATGVKLLDFGLARIASPVTSSATVAANSVQPTAAVPLTAHGAILGTFQYMSPEQVEGRDTDARSDIFSFGVVLYEMLTGQRVFEGQSPASVMSAILKDEPPAISTVQPLAPPALDRIVQRCLAKSPATRWHSLHDVAIELEWARSTTTERPVARKAPLRRELVAWVIAGTAALGGMGLLLVGGSRPAATGAAAVAARFPLGMSQVLPSPAINAMAVPSPDGRWIAMAGNGGDRAPIVLRNVADGTTRDLPDTEGARSPFWSPDSGRIAFFGGGALRWIDLASAKPIVVCQCESLAGQISGAWVATDTIVFTSVDRRTLSKVSVTSGQLSAATTLDETRGEFSHASPQALPDGRHFLFEARASTNRTLRVVAGSIESSERKDIPVTSNVSFVDSGWLLSVQSGSLNAQPFDLNRLETTGPPAIVSPLTARFLIGPPAYRFAASRNGVLVLWAGGSNASELRWVDREGKTIESVGEHADYSNPALSPDGKTLAVSIRTESGTRDIWLIDLERRSRTRVTTDGADDLNPIWSPDGKTVYFASDRSGTRELYRIRPFTAGSEERLVAGVTVNPESVTPDGRTMVYNNNTSSRTSSVLYQLTLSTPTPDPVALPSSIANSRDSQISPDGRWLAFSSGTLAGSDLYVTAFPKPDRLWQLSTEGVLGQPQWRRDGRELFYTDLAGRMMSVSVAGTGSSFVAGLPKPLFTRRLTPFAGRNRFLVSPDGQRFLLNADIEDQTTRDYDVIVNWPALLKK